MPARATTAATSSATEATSATPRRARGRATRARLVDAGIAMFSRKGFHATRVDDIVKRARTSHGTFYLYFSSKDDLFEHLVTQVVEEFHQLTDALPRIRDDEPSRAALEGWLASFIGLYGHYGPLIRSWTDAESPGESTSAVPDLTGTIAAELAAKVKVRATKRFDPAVASLVVVAMVERLNYFLSTGQLQEPAEEVPRVLAAIVMDAFYGPGH